jgi:hypothetical protein
MRFRGAGVVADALAAATFFGFARDTGGADDEDDEDEEDEDDFAFAAAAFEATVVFLEEGGVFIASTSLRPGSRGEASHREDVARS